MAINDHVPDVIKAMVLYAESPTFGLFYKGKEVNFPGYARIFNSNWVGPWVWEVPVGAEVTADEAWIFNHKGEKVWFADFHGAITARADTEAAKFMMTGPLLNLFYDDRGFPMPSRIGKPTWLR